MKTETHAIILMYIMLICSIVFGTMAALIDDKNIGLIAMSVICIVLTVAFANTVFDTSEKDKNKKTKG